MNQSIDKDETFKLPRLYVETALKRNRVITLSSAQAHYLNNVLRRSDGDAVRLFNGQDGEWAGHLQNLSKRQADVALDKQLIEQPENERRVHLIFTPIKKNRMDWLIEKAVELGATDFHPILSQNTEVRKIKDERLNSQIFEAAEQCERLSIPKLHDLEKLDRALDRWDQKTSILSCIERYGAKDIQQVAQGSQNEDIAVLIGPEGGFTKEEKDYIATKTTPVSLGNTILRCETAVIKALIQVQS